MKATDEASQLIGEKHEDYWSGNAGEVACVELGMELVVLHQVSCSSHELPGRSEVGTCEVPI